jgi:hypothetical protein
MRTDNLNCLHFPGAIYPVVEGPPCRRPPGTGGSLQVAGVAGIEVDPLTDQATTLLSRRIRFRSRGLVPAQTPALVGTASANARPCAGPGGTPWLPGRQGALDRGLAAGNLPAGRALGRAGVEGFSYRWATQSCTNLTAGGGLKRLSPDLTPPGGRSCA